VKVGRWIWRSWVWRGHERRRPAEKAKPWTFWPALQDAAPAEMTYYLRTNQDPLSLAQAARQSVAGLDASLPVFNVKTVET
jgi:hypothetical protein